MKMNSSPYIIFVNLLVVVLFINCGHTQLGPFPRQELDNRCFLNGGGSTLSFFVKESLPISSVVGRLDIQGDIESDIELLLEEENSTGLLAPVEVKGSDLVLTNKLDKEGLDGPSSFAVNVRCRRKKLRKTLAVLQRRPDASIKALLGRSNNTSKTENGGLQDNVDYESDDNNIEDNNPDFIIPISVHVTDVNDNIPQFIGKTPYQLNISELTIVGSRISTGIIRAVDNDQPGPFSTVEYLIKPGSKHSEYVGFENPLEGSLVLTKRLDYETLREFEVTIIARDQGVPPQSNETTILISVSDADDQNPAFYYERYDALLPRGEDARAVGQKLLVQPQDIKAFDKDLGIAAPVYYTFGGSGGGGNGGGSVDTTYMADEYKYFELNRNTGHIYIMTNIPDTEFLQPATLVVKATQYDNPDRYAVTTLTITRGGIFDSDLQFLQRMYAVRILENAPLNSAIVTLLTNKPLDRRVHFHIDENSMTTIPASSNATKPNKGLFSVSQIGDIMLRKPLDYEQHRQYSFLVYVTDGRKNDSARVNVSVLNINDWDPRFKYPQYEFYVPQKDKKVGHIVGKLEVHDGDEGDSVTLELKGSFARVFTINKKGQLIIQDLSYLNDSDEAHIVVVAKDSGTPARQTSVAVAIRFGETSSKYGRRLSGFENLEDDALTLAIALGLVVVVFLIVIVSLIAYICNNKKKRAGSFTESTIATDHNAEIVNPTAMKNYLSISNHSIRRDSDLDGNLRHFSRPLTTSPENYMVQQTRTSNPELHPKLTSNVNYNPSHHPKNMNGHLIEPNAFQISGSVDRLSVNSFTTTTTVPSGQNLRNAMGGSMTVLNPLNPQSANTSAENQRQRHKRRSNVKHNGSVSSNMSKNNKISPQSKILGNVVSSNPGSQLSSPSIHIPGLPDVEELQKHSRRNHRLTSSTLMSSKSTLDDIDDLDSSNDRMILTNEAKYAKTRAKGGSQIFTTPENGKFTTTDEDSLEVNSTTRLHQKEISPTSRNGLQQSLREAILGGSGGSSNGDGNNSHRDMVRIEWPRNSIPRRVKKLSWEDEYDLGDSSVFDMGIPPSGASVQSDMNGSIHNNGTAAGVASIASGTIVSSIVAHHQQDRDNSTLTDTEGTTAMSPASNSSNGGLPPPYMLQENRYYVQNGGDPTKVQIGKSIYF